MRSKQARWPHHQPIREDATPRRTITVQAGGQIITAAEPIPDDALHALSRLRANPAHQMAQLRALTEVPGSGHPWPAEIGGGHFGGGKVTITHVDPVLVVEVAADTALQAGRHRHALRLLRVRADLDPEDVDPA